MLINNAGILRDRMLTNMDESEWDSVIQVHLKGTFAPSRHAAAYWRDESKKIGGPVKGRIINTSSTSGIYGNVGQTNYGAAKAGIAAFTIIAARELRRYGVTVNAISPVGADAHDRGPARADRRAGARCAIRSGCRRRSSIWRARRPRTSPAASSRPASAASRVCEGWRRGAEVEQVADPAEAGACSAR